MYCIQDKDTYQFLLNALHEQHLRNFTKVIIYLLMEGRWRHTRQSIFLWNLSPLVVYLRTQTKYPKVPLEAFLSFSQDWKLWPNYRNRNFKLLQKRAMFSTLWSGLRWFFPWPTLKSWAYVTGYVSKLSSLGIVDIFFSDESAHASASLTPVTRATRRTHKMHEPDKISSCLCMSCDDQHWQRI